MVKPTSISGAPYEARWLRAEPRRTLPASHLERIVHTAGHLHAGGTPPQHGRRLARLVDVTTLCESLTRDQLPDAIVAELIEIISAVVETRDPRLA
jgi:hypothetical protein